MSTWKTKAIHTDLSTLRHNQAYPGIIPTYPGIFRTMCYSDILWYIQNPNIFRTRNIFITLLYSECCHIQNPRHIQNPVKHLRWSNSRKQLMTIVIFTNYDYVCKACRVLSLMSWGSFSRRSYSLQKNYGAPGIGKC